MPSPSRQRELFFPLIVPTLAKHLLDCLSEVESQREAANQKLKELIDSDPMVAEKFVVVFPESRFPGLSDLYAYVRAALRRAEDPTKPLGS